MYVRMSKIGRISRIGEQRGDHEVHRLGIEAIGADPVGEREVDARPGDVDELVEGRSGPLDGGPAPREAGEDPGQRQVEHREDADGLPVDLLAAVREHQADCEECHDAHGVECEIHVRPFGGCAGEARSPGLMQASFQEACPWEPQPRCSPWPSTHPVVLRMSLREPTAQVLRLGLVKVPHRSHRICGTGSDRGCDRCRPPCEQDSEAYSKLLTNQALTRYFLMTR